MQRIGHGKIVDIPRLSRFCAVSIRYAALARMSDKGAKSPAIASAAASTTVSDHAFPTKAASAKDARFGTPAMPPNATRADVTTPPSTTTLKHPQTALIS